MREIKFRVWDKKEKRWSNLPRISSIDSIFWEFIGSKYQMENLIIQQYTGLKDKNGKEIYEGDIVKYEYEAFDHQIEKDEGEVFFEDGIFYFDRKRMFASNDCNFKMDSLEVAGHIQKEIWCAWCGAWGDHASGKHKL